MSKPSTSRRGDLRVVDERVEPGMGLAPLARTNLAIEVKNASLQYPIGAYHRGSIKSALLSLFGHRDNTPRPTFVDALRGLNLGIAYGERVGLIGHNGSGKSTFLRALAGIYPLAGGDISVVGRIGTLLEVGLGFETESTGRENIFYRGMTMGYSRKQMERVEADIVAFADLGDFIDMPMRTYSSGMYVRLGFAISTQFAPEILLVDEVFGAGDAAFAKKALNRMMAIVQTSGIFVIATHDIALVSQICTRVLWLERGQVKMDGPPSIVVPEFTSHMAAS